MGGRTGGGSKGGLVRKMLSPPVAEHTTVPSLASNHPITHTPPTRHSAEKSHRIIKTYEEPSLRTLPEHYVLCVFLFQSRPPNQQSYDEKQ